MIDEELEASDCSLSIQTQIGVAAEEIYLNIANNAYTLGTGDAEVSIDIVKDSIPIVVIRFDDEGIYFDPLARPVPDVAYDS